MRVAVILDQSGTIVKAHRILCDVLTGACFPCDSTLGFAEEKRASLVNVRGRIGDIARGDMRRVSLKVSWSPDALRGEFPRGILSQPGIIESLKKSISQVAEACGKGLGVCAGLLVDAEGRATHAVALGGEIYGDVPGAVSELRSGGDDVFLATGNCRSFSVRCARSLGIPEEFVLFDADPADKLDLVRRLKSYYGFVIMVGNDINDLVAMGEADLGVLLRRRGDPSGEGLERRAEADYVLDSLSGVCGIVRKVKEPLPRNTGRGTRDACGEAP